MISLPLLFRTLRPLKPIQIVNRLWRKRPIGAARAGDLPVRKDCALAATFPAFPMCRVGAATFTFLHETHVLEKVADWNNAAWPKLWLYNLHYFDYVRQEGAREDPVSQALILRWIDENPVGKGNGWEPYPISLRVVNWIKFLLASNRAEDVASRIRASLVQQVRYLLPRLEYHLLANHVLANAKALVFAGCYFTGAEAAQWYQKGLAIYRRELPEQILADGTHFELSAMYHAIILEDVLDVWNITQEELFKTTAQRMLAALQQMTDPAGELILFNDAAPGIALAPRLLQEYAARLGVGETGIECTSLQPYWRVTRGAFTLVVKTSREIGPTYQPGHAHADSLTFELWQGEVKIVTDTGTDRYAVDAERRYQRSTAAHNTIVVNGRNSSEVWAGHRVGVRAQTRIVAVHIDDARAVLTIEHNGYAPIIHRRTFELTATGLTIREELLGGAACTMDLYVHLTSEGAAQVRLSCDADSFTYAPCAITAGFGAHKMGVCASIHRDNVPLPQCFTWALTQSLA